MLLLVAVAIQPAGAILGGIACCADGVAASDVRVAAESEHMTHGCCGGDERPEPAGPPSDNDRPEDRDGPCDCPMSCCIGKVMPTAPPALSALIVPAPRTSGSMAVPSDAVLSPPHLKRLKRPPRVFTLA